MIAVPALDHDKMMQDRYGVRVGPTGQLERRIVAHLIDYLDRNGFAVVGVFDGEEYTAASDAKSAMELIFNLDEASLRVKRRDEIGKNGREHGILLVLGNGEDVLSDWNYSEGDPDNFNATMEAWEVDDAIQLLAPPFNDNELRLMVDAINFALEGDLWAGPDGEDENDARNLRDRLATVALDGA